jgi:hypothetical protein
MSFTITRNLTPDVDIPHLILRGLAVLASAEDIPNEGIADPGTVITPFDAEASEGGIESDVIALPSVNCQITWQTSYASTPAVANVQLMVSVDGLHFNTLDTTTDVDGEIRTVLTAARFARMMFGTMDDGIDTTVKLVVQEVSFSPLS